MRTRTKTKTAATTRTIAATAVALLAGVAAGIPAAAQERDADPGRDRGTTRCAAPWTALGIDRFSCTACSLSYGGGDPHARFGVEPQIFPMERSVARGDEIRAGDRLVAVDGELITTVAGASALLGVETGDEVTLTVRRDGETRELHVVAGDGCDVEPPPPPGAAPAAPRPGRTPGALPAPRAEAPPSPASAPTPFPPSAPAPPMPAPAPAAPSELLPRARLGFAFSCSDCGLREGRWFFSGPPEVTGVERGGPAWEAGFRTGDRIVSVGGEAIESEAGERAFGSIEPGDRVRWEVRRDGRAHTLVLTATEKPARPAVAPMPPRPAGPTVAGGLEGLESPAEVEGGVLRYQGRVGNTDVEVRGAPVTVTVAEEAGAIVIRTSDAVIRLTKESGGTR